MSNSYCFIQSNIENPFNQDFIRKIHEYAESQKQQIYVIHSPLGEDKYKYACSEGLIVLTPKHKIIFANFSTNNDAIDDYYDDVIEDIGAISDKFRYKEQIGRPKSWKKLTTKENISEHTAFDTLLKKNKLEEPIDQKISELLISLLTGSINDIERVTAEIPEFLLDKIKQKILLFDSEQTRFIYEKLPNKRITIQGLSGTGKTELLLHKLKEIYISSNEGKVLFTCHNRILAANMKRRIPDFFNFMKVEQQIKWEERLWCIHAWGSSASKDSGTYRYLCDFYNLPFYTYSRSMSFERACKILLNELNKIPEIDFKYAFDTILIDESQDFPDVFFDLCEKVTKQKIYVAGDIFQSIFDSKIIDEIKPTYLLSKCYRTDPRTLMFSHALGMGLFEPQKLRWLDDDEWGACGYILDKQQNGEIYSLSREPLRRFEDLEVGERDGTKLIEITDSQFFRDAVVDQIINIIEEVKQENPTVKPDDIGVIFVDADDSSYYMGTSLSIKVPEKVGWEINLAYSSKEKISGMLFVSNKNNAKGLEFPFVICVARKIQSARHYRNALYMIMTRSFIRTYLIVAENENSNILPYIKKGLAEINQTGHMNIQDPGPSERERLKTTITLEEPKESLLDCTNKIFEQQDIPTENREKLVSLIQSVFSDEFEFDVLDEFIRNNNDSISKQKK